MNLSDTKICGDQWNIQLELIKMLENSRSVNKRLQLFNTRNKIRRCEGVI